MDQKASRRRGNSRQLAWQTQCWLRINGGNVPSALVDSLIFPTLAFGSFLWPIVLGQFAAKTLRGFVWSLVFRWMDQRAVVQAGQPFVPR